VNDLIQCAGNENDAQNMALATATHAALVVRSQLYDRGIKRARFVVIRETKIPAVLVEGGFLSHSFDAKIIATPEYRQAMASSIVLAINNYRRAVGAGSPNPVASMQGSATEPRVRLNTEAVSPRSESTVPNAAGGNATSGNN
jgi:N-acetylmuramoyl-L-alanine amidase